MKRLLIVIVLSITILFSCTKPLDDIVILNVKDKSSSTADNSVYTTTGLTNSTSTALPNTTSVVTDDKEPQSTTTTPVEGGRVLIINKSSKKIHLSEDCSYAGKISVENKVLVSYTEMYSYLQNGYEICSYCEKHY